jgi:pantothenate kinase
MNTNAILEIAGRLAEAGEYDESQVRVMGVAIGGAVYLYRRGLLGEFVRRLRGIESSPSGDQILNFIFGLEDRWLVEMIDQLRNKRGFLNTMDALLPPAAEAQALYELVYAPGAALA